MLGTGKEAVGECKGRRGRRESKRRVVLVVFLLTFLAVIPRAPKRCFFISVIPSYKVRNWPY